MTNATAELDDVVDAVVSHPGLINKSVLALVTEALGPTDWVSGPGDDGAVIDAHGAKVVACGEAMLPRFVARDPYGAGFAAVLTNINDVAAMGGVPLGIVNTIVATPELARTALDGMRHAGELYDVPIVGGHLTEFDGPPSISAFAVGTTRSVLSVTRARPGHSLLLAAALDGEMRTDFPFFRAFEQRGCRCAGDVRVLAQVAGSGACVAAKDVSMAGVIGSLAMLLECRGLGASVDLDVLPRPGGVSLAAWLNCFPSFAFLMCSPPGREAECLEPFRERGLHVAVIGTLDGSGDIALRLGGQRRVALNVVNRPATRLAR